MISDRSEHVKSDVVLPETVFGFSPDSLHGTIDYSYITKRRTKSHTKNRTYTVLFCPNQVLSFLTLSFSTDTTSLQHTPAVVAGQGFAEVYDKLCSAAFTNDMLPGPHTPCKENFITALREQCIL